MCWRAATEVLVAHTMAQPAVPGEFYDLYHGFMEARPVTDDTSEIRYTLVYDISNLADEAAREADRERRRRTFEGALDNMKELAEAQ